MRDTDAGRLLADLGEGDLSNILKVAVDQALLINDEGVILEALCGSSPVPGVEAWAGKDWRATVTDATRPKLDRLLTDIAANGVSRFRQVNHPSEAGDIPVGYTIVRLPDAGGLLAIGRNLQALAELQRQLVEAQQAMETEYWHVRQAEARYRLLFQQSVEPILLLDAEGDRITDANRAAADLFGIDLGKLTGRAFPPPSLRVGPDFDDASRASFQETLEQLAVGTIDRASVEVRVGAADRRFALTASVVRFDGTRTVLIRMESEGRNAERQGEVDALDLLDRSPDGFVVANPDGEVLFANPAFVNMVQAADARSIVGRSLGLWLGRPGADLTVILTQLREHGHVRIFNTELEGEHGISTPVELSAVAAFDADDPVIGITIRNVARRLPVSEASTRDLNTAIERLSDRVGEVSLKQLVEDTVSMVERQFIEAALELTGDNRTATAELLGLSRQSLYTKLKRYRLDPPAS